MLRSMFVLFYSTEAEKKRETSKPHSSGAGGVRQLEEGLGDSWDTGQHDEGSGRYLALVLPLCLHIVEEHSKKRSDQQKTQQPISFNPTNAASSQDGISPVKLLTKSCFS